MNAADETNTLVVDARQGSREAFAQLVRLHHDAVRTFVARYLPRAEAADDVAQEVFLVAFRQLDRYRGEAAFSHWLLGIARNLALAYLRRESRRQRHELEAMLARWQAERLDDADGHAAQHERSLAALRDCIDRLPQDCREVVDRYYFEQQPAESIARQIDKQAGAVRMMLLRIRRALAKCISAKLARGDEP